MMNSEAAVEIDALQVRRGRRSVLRGLSLAVPAGKVVGLLGPSGSGKSTLLRAIVGTQRVTAGSVTVLGRPAGSADLRASVGYMTQAASVYDDLTAVENLAYFARVLGTPRDDVARVLREVDLAESGARLVGSLSGGQRARVSLAVALLGSPRLLVLDEPTVGLDPVLRRDLWNLFGALASRGVTLIISSHVMDEARRCDRILLLDDGLLLADTTSAGLLEATGTADVDDAFLTLVEAAA